MRLAWLVVVVLVGAISCVSSQKKVAERDVAGRKTAPNPHFRKATENLNTEFPASSPEAQACMRAICGSEDTNVGATDLVEYLDREFFYKPGTKLYKDFDQLITEAINQDLQTYRLNHQKTQYLLKNKDKIALSKEQKRFVAISELFHRWSSGIKAVQKRQSELGYYEPAEYDLVADEVMAQGMDQGNLIVAKTAEYKGYFALMANVTSNFFNVPLNHLLYNAFPDSSPDEAISEALADCKKGVNTVRERLDLPHTFGGFDYCDSVNAVSELNLQRFQRAYEKMYLWRELSDPEYWSMLDEYEFSFQEDIARFFQSERFKRIAYLGARNFEGHERVGEVKNLCHRAVRENIETATSKLRQRKITEHIEILKAQVPRLISFKDQMIQEDFLKRFKKISFELPPARPDVIAELKKSFKTIAEFQGEFESPATTEIEKLKIALSEFYLALFQEDLGKLVDGDPEDLLAATGSACQAYQLPALHDHIYTSSGSAVLSWGTFLRPAQGIGVIAHELAHGVAGILWEMGQEQLGERYGQLSERLPLWERRSCVNDYHYTSMDPNRESQYAEEDWADYFAAHVIKSAKSELPWAKNFGCLLTQEREDGYQTQLENDLYATHSHPFFRVLHIESTMKGKLPKACQAFAEKPMSCQ